MGDDRGRSTRRTGRAIKQRAQHISYASTAQTRSGRAIIRMMENATGRLGLMRRAEGYDTEITQSSDFWQVISNRYGINLNIVAGSLDNIPRHGPLIIVSNHPYGLLDGLMMGRLLSQRRGDDFKILAHQIFQKSPVLEQIILPICFDPSKTSAKTNLKTRNRALKYLNEGGAIGVFPGGTVSTSRRLFSPPMDPNWRTFTAKLIAKSDATVVPVFFCGANSRLFQLASQIHSTLRLGLLIREFRTRVDTSVDIVIGAPISRAELDAQRGDPKACMDFLRKATYELSPSGIDAQIIGREFDKSYKGR